MIVAPGTDRRGREERMETVIARLLSDFETGKVTRRHLIQSLAAIASAAASAAPVAAAGGFKTVSLDHISLEVTDYRRTRDFYAELMGMRVENDSARFSQCELHFGDSMIIARNRPSRSGPSGARVDHVAYRIGNWDTDTVKAELDRRGLKPRLDTGQPIGPADYASFHVKDPDGFDLQISGTARPGDSQYKKSGK
jgi:catechol 2,3-dioxygenase-like lactoylglutathione lyase family enzyme